jgi:maleamate amidohydrolase
MTPENKHEIYQQAGLTNRLGFGQTPALIVVDMQIAFTVPEESPLAGNLGAEIISINRLIAAARSQAVPIIFTAIEFDPVQQADGGLWVKKCQRFVS